MEGKAYWYNNQNLFDIGAKKHVHYIIDYPDIFSLRQDDILSTYAFYNEKLYSEGKAREDLIKKVTEHGWIRLRHYQTPIDYWSIQCYDTHKQKEDLFSIVMALLNLTKDLHLSDELVFTGFNKNNQEVYSFQQGGVATYLEENKDLQSQTLRLVYDFNEMRPV